MNLMQKYAEQRGVFEAAYDSGDWAPLDLPPRLRSIFDNVEIVGVFRKAAPRGRKRGRLLG